MRTRIRTILAFLAGCVLLTASTLPSSARDGGGMGARGGVRGFSGLGFGHGFGHGFGSVQGHGHLRWGGVGRGWRGAGVYLDRQSDPVIIVNVDRSGPSAPAAPAFFVPSVADLPTMAGIRKPPPAAPA